MDSTSKDAPAAAAAKATMADIKPYGFMADAFEAALGGRPPRAWNGSRPFEAWIDTMAAAIADAIWPAWDPAAAKWSGKSASGAAIALTVADLELMRNLSTRYPRMARTGNAGKTHEWWFMREDVLFGEIPSDYPHGSSLEDRFAACFPDCAIAYPALRKAFNSGGTASYAGSLSWILKHRLQRPRPHQMAAWLGLRAPVVHLAVSAWSPSAISGHAYQGMMAALQIHTRYGALLAPREATGLRELAADIGDRRVFAGVHYPSDNLTSWWSALEAIPCLARDEGERRSMTDFVTDAVRASEVYAAMRASPGHRAALGVLEPWGL